MLKKMGYSGLPAGSVNGRDFTSQKPRTGSRCSYKEWRIGATVVTSIAMTRISQLPSSD